MEGFLWKRGDKGLVKGNKRRWFTLAADGTLSYFEDTSEAKNLGTIDVSRAVRVSRGNATKQRGKVAAFAENVFEIEVPGRCYTLTPEQPGELADWVTALAAHVQPPAFRGDLRGIAEAAGPPAAVPRPPRSPPRAAAPVRASAPPAEPYALVAVEDEDDMPERVIEGNGRSGGGGGFFSRLGGGSGGGAASEASAARLRELEEGYARMQTEVVGLKQELAVIRPAGSARKGSGVLGERLLSGGGGGGGGRGSRAGAKGAGLGGWEDDEDDDEPELLPGCGCCGGRCTCKVFFLILANIVVIATGCAIAAAGGLALAEKQAFAALLSPTAVYVLLGVGVGFALMGVLGSFAATRYTKATGKCLLLLYVIFMAVLTAGEVLGGIAIVVEAEGLKLPKQGGQAQGQVTEFLGHAFTTCCNTTAAHRGSDSCAWLPKTVLKGCPGVDEAAFEARVMGFLKNEILPIGGVAAALGLIHGAAAWFALTLICPCCSRLCCCCCRKKQDDAGGGRPGNDDRPRKGSSRRRRKSSAYDDDFAD